MAIKTVLFDLDGTLLPLEQEPFVKAYFSRLAKKLAPHGYDPEKLVDGIWKGTAAMIRNDGTRTNEQVFWDTFSALFGERVRADEPLFASYYEHEFQEVQSVCGFAPEAREAVMLCHRRGMQTVLATNPIFPAVATESRMRWAGLTPADFVLYTTYENSRSCKPDPAYYREILQKLSLSPAECVMVGNDVAEDMIAAELGMSVFLLTDHLINPKNVDIAQYPHGGFGELLDFLKTV